MAFTSRGILRLTLFLAGYASFLAMGAFLFSIIEGPEEEQRKKELREMRATFLREHPCVSGKYNYYLTTIIVITY